MNSADVMTPSVPSFCTPGSPPSALFVMSFQRPRLRISLPSSEISRTRPPAASRTSKRTTSSKRILRSWWFTRRTIQSWPPGMAMRNETRLSMQVPHSTQSLPPAFSAMLPPMVQAQALVGSVAKTSPWWVACSIAASVMTPASRSIRWPSTVRPSSRTNGRVEMPRIRFSFSVFTITQSGVSGMAPPVRPVPAPRGMAWSPRLRMVARSGATCDSSVGVTTARGRWSRQSVASVAWATSVNGSSSTFSRPTTAPSARRRRACRSGARRTSSRTPSSMRLASARTSRTSVSRPAPSWMSRRLVSASPKKRFRRREEMTSSWRR